MTEIRIHQVARLKESKFPEDTAVLLVIDNPPAHGGGHQRRCAQSGKRVFKHVFNLTDVPNRFGLPNCRHVICCPFYFWQCKKECALCDRILPW